MVLRAGIVGCGKIAGGYERVVPSEWSLTHAGAYHICSKTQLVAVADPNLQILNRFGEKWQVQNTYSDYREMLEKERLDILSICLPTEYHFEVFKVALHHDIRGILCEKPLSRDIEKARKMRVLGRGRVVTVNYFRRFNLTLSDIQNRILNGEFGRCLHATFRYTKGLFVNGSHLVDLARWFWGEPEEIRFIGYGSKDSYDPGIDFALTFSDGVSAYFLHIPQTKYVFIDVDILTERGRVVIGQRGQSVSEYRIAPEPYYQVFDILESARQTETEWRYCSLRAVEEIVACLRNGEETSCTLEDGCRAVEICREVVTQSMQQEGQARLPIKRLEFNGK